VDTNDLGPRDAASLARMIGLHRAMLDRLRQSSRGPRDAPAAPGARREDRLRQLLDRAADATAELHDYLNSLGTRRA
jgi:hypothetical protein